MPNKFQKRKIAAYIHAVIFRERRLLKALDFNLRVLFYQLDIRTRKQCISLDSVEEQVTFLKQYQAE